MLDRIKLKLTTKVVPRANLVQQNKLKLVSILLNIVAHRLLQDHPSDAALFLTFLTAAMRMGNRVVGGSSGEDSPSDELGGGSSNGGRTAQVDMTSQLLDNVPNQPLLLVV